MATTIKDLLTQAAVIRDAASQGENTAMRVGTLFVDLVQRIVDTLSAEALSALGLRTTATEDKIIITYKTVDAGGTAKDASVTLPSATTATAGVMSSAQLAAINNATQDISSIIQRLTTSETSIKTATDSTKAVADALTAHAAANDKAFADEASARKAVSDALTAHEKTDAADHAAIRKTLSDSLASAKQEQHDTLGISGIVAFDGFVGDVTDDTSDTAAPIVRDPKGKVQQGATTVHFSTADGNFLIKQDGSYYPIWDDDSLWQDRNQEPWSDKAYYNVNDGKLYKIGSDNQLHEIALTQLRDDIGILPCKVRTSAPRAEPTTGYPPVHNYTIWWSQTAKAFFAALGYDEAAQDDAIENYNYYPLSVCDEYTDYCTLSGSGSTQTAVPRTDRIYRSGNDLWQYDKAAGKMAKLINDRSQTWFRDYWNMLCGQILTSQDKSYGGYDYASDTYTLNGLTLTEAEARRIALYADKSIINSDTYSRFSGNAERTVLPILIMGRAEGRSMQRAFGYDNKKEAITFRHGVNDTRCVSDIREAFASNTSLKSIDGLRLAHGAQTGYAFWHCYALETLQLYNLDSDLDLSDCEMLSAGSILFIAKWSAATAKRTLTLHHNVYSQLTPIQIAEALNKNISIAEAAEQ